MTPADASTRESSSTARIASKKVPPPPPYCSGVSMRHDSKLEKLVDDTVLEDTFFVHFANVRANCFVGKLADIVTEKLLVFGEAKREAWVRPFW